MKKSLQLTAIIASIIFIGGGIFVYKFFHLFAHFVAPFTGRYQRGDIAVEALQNATAVHNANIANTYHIIGILLIACGVFLGILLFALSLTKENK